MLHTLILLLFTIFLATPASLYAVCDASPYPLPNKQWHQISLPCSPGVNNTVAAVFGDDISGELGSDWALYRYDGDHYVPLDDPADRLSQGVGYWIIQINDAGETKVLDLPNSSTPTPAGRFDIALKTRDSAVHWNMIGYPFKATSSLSNAQVVAASGNCMSGCNLNAAEAPKIVHNKLWTFNGANYTEVGAGYEFNPWTAYWLATLENAHAVKPVSLSIAPSNNPEPPITSINLPSQAPFSAGRRPFISAITGEANKIATTQDEIISIVTSAKTGDRIGITNGTYDIGELTLRTPNVQLFALNKGNVIFNGRSKLILEADKIAVEGFVFEEGDLDIRSASQAILVRGDDVHISQCEFLRWGLHTYEAPPISNKEWTIVIEIDPYANQTEISDSHFSDLYGISILKGQSFTPDFSGGKGLWVHHNDWIDNPYRMGLGKAGEALHAGTAWSTAQGIPGERDYDDDLGAIFENNHILRHFAEFEIVSLKSRGNIVRANIVEDCQSAGFVIRMGNENLIYGNWMTGITRSAVRISGEKNIVAFNYFKGTPTAQYGIIELHSETKFDPVSPGLFNSYWAANQTRVHRNIIENAPYFLSILRGAPFDPLSPIPNPTYPFVSSPKNGVYSQNFFLGGEEGYTDIADAMDRSIFLSENTLKNNPTFTKNQDKWETANPLSFDPFKPLQIDPNWNIPGVKNQLRPPSWWSQLNFD